MESGKTNFYTQENIRPINEEELAVVPLNQELTILLTIPDHTGLNVTAVNFNETYYDFNTAQWVIVHAAQMQQDPVENKIVERDEFIKQANIKLQLIDLPTSLKTVLTEYITQLNELEITSENSASVIIPRLPI